MSHEAISIALVTIRDAVSPCKLQEKLNCHSLLTIYCESIHFYFKTAEVSNGKVPYGYTYNLSTYVG